LRFATRPVSSRQRGNALVIAIAGTGDQLIAMRTRNKAPLFTATYDFPKLMDFAERSGSLERDAPEPDVRAFLAILKDMLGNFSGTVDVTERGLGMWSAVEFR